MADPLTIGMAVGQMGMAAAKGGLFSTTDPGKAARDANQANNIYRKGIYDNQGKVSAYLEQQTIDAINRLWKNQDQILNRIDESSARDWGHRETLRIDTFVDEIHEWNQSIEEATNALNFNEISFNIAAEKEKERMQDYYTNMRYEVADAKLQLAQQLTTSVSKRNQLRSQQEGVRVAHQYEQSATSITGLMEQGKVLASGTAGRSTRKATQAILAGVGNEKAMRADALYNKNSQFRDAMQESYNKEFYNKTGFKQTIKQVRSSLDSELAASSIRSAQIHATRFGADMAAIAKIENVPKLGRMTPIPWKQIRPNLPDAPEEGTWKNFRGEQPHLEDHAKISGQRPQSGWTQVANIGLAGIQGFAQAGGFGGGDGGGTPTPDYSPTGGPLAGPGFDPSSMPGYFGNPLNQ